MRKICFVLLVLVFLLSSTVVLTSGQSEDEKFQKFLDSYFDALWKFYPSLGTLQGYHKYDDKLEDMGKKNIEKMHDTLDKFNQELVAKIDRFGLNPDNQIDHAMMVGIVDVADEEPEIQRQGQDDEKAEDDLFEIHGPWS